MLRDAPSAEKRIFAALHLVVHGPYASAQQRANLMHPSTSPMCHNGELMKAEAVLRAAVSAVFEAAHPLDLDRISQAVAKALEQWDEQFVKPDGESRWTPR